VRKERLGLIAPVSNDASVALTNVLIAEKPATSGSFARADLPPDNAGESSPAILMQDHGSEDGFQDLTERSDSAN
jgi:hypothetical protein